MIPEARQQKRLPCNDELGHLPLVREYVSNVSRGGVFIRSDVPLPPGTYVELDFNLITDEGFETIRGVGEVRRISSQPSGMGVAFLALEAESEALINRIFPPKGSPGASDEHR